MTLISTNLIKAMTTAPIVQKQNAKISNFSVASLLADTITKSPAANPYLNQKDHNQRIPSPASSLCDEKSNHHYPSSKHELERSQTPHSSIASDDYDSNQDEEDSIVDIEDVNNENTEMTQLRKLQKPPCTVVSSAGGTIPIRPTPFSAIAAAAVSWSGVGGGLQWSASRQLSSLNTAVGLFSSHGLTGAQLSSGM